MAPPIEHFLPEELEARAQFNAKGRYRKGGVDLEKCKLMEMLQYDCWVERRVSQPFVKCRPLVRMFRKCANGLTVETTSWEDLESRW
ncbi:uncharacterized protein J3D65DRAFT_614511 [Phyllosticta citribraziliensis]|uniref:COX assembly mitochondrial protein n=1 Tax=Phyllosticta citribraziliensis TaxID=989973 RepID=A0ABR1M4Y2_9PEZI